MKRSVAFLRGLIYGPAAGFFVNMRDGLVGRAAHVGGTLVRLTTTSVTHPEGFGAPTDFVFTVGRTGDTSGTSSVNWAVTGSGGLNAADFVGGVLPSGTLTFTSGQTSKTITVQVNGDATVEADENFTVTLSSPVGCTLGLSVASGTIVNDDATIVALTTSSVTHAEGNTGSTSFDFTVSRSGDVSGSSSVDWAVSGSGGLNGSDFAGGVLPSGTLNWTSGQSSKTISVLVAGDTAVESTENFTVTLSNASGCTLGASTATGTITNDDVPDDQPDAYNFNTSSGAELGAPVISDPVTLTNYTTPFTLSFAGSPGDAQMTTDGGATWGSSRTANPPSVVVQLKRTASLQYSTALTTILDANGVQGSWSMSTKADPANLTLVGPGASWNGGAKSGYAGGTAPVTEASPRTTYGLTLKARQPDLQAFATDLPLGFLAFHKSGIAKIEVWSEGGTPTVIPSALVVDTGPSGRTRKQWATGWCKLDIASFLAKSTTGTADIYVRATANDVTVEPRVLGPLRYYPRPTRYDHTYTVALGGGADFTDIKSALDAVRTNAGGYERPRVQITQNGGYHCDSQTGAEAYFKGHVTIECAPGVSATLKRNTLTDPNTDRVTWKVGGLEFGKGLTIDRANIAYFSLPPNTFEGVLRPYWVNGARIINSEGQDSYYWHGEGHPPGFSDTKGWFTDVQGEDVNSTFAAAKGVVNCDIYKADGDALGVGTEFVADTHVNLFSAKFFFDALSHSGFVLRTPAGADDYSIRSDWGTYTFELRKNGLVAHTITFGVNRGDPNLTAKDLVDAINALGDPAWSARLVTDGKHNKYINSGGGLSGARRKLGLAYSGTAISTTIQSWPLLESSLGTPTKLRVYNEGGGANILVATGGGTDPGSYTSIAAGASVTLVVGGGHTNFWIKSASGTVSQASVEKIITGVDEQVQYYTDAHDDVWQSVNSEVKANVVFYNLSGFRTEALSSIFRISNNDLTDGAFVNVAMYGAFDGWGLGQNKGTLVLNASAAGGGGMGVFGPTIDYGVVRQSVAIYYWDDGGGTNLQHYPAMQDNYLARYFTNAALSEAQHTGNIFSPLFAPFDVQMDALFRGAIDGDFRPATSGVLTTAGALTVSGNQRAVDPQNPVDLWNNFKGNGDGTGFDAVGAVSKNATTARDNFPGRRPTLSSPITNQAGVPLSDTRTTGVITISGLGAGVRIPVRAYGPRPNASFKINGVTASNNDTVGNGDTLEFLVTSSAWAGAPVLMEIVIGPLFFRWSVTTDPSAEEAGGGTGPFFGSTDRFFSDTSPIFAET